MNLVISIVLAASSILATFMLQLCDDRATGNTSLIALGSFFAILLAVVFVDYKKKFSISKGACNFLVLLVVALQMGTLLKSRQDFMAFTIANILASIQAVLFFQEKTTRKCYQILFISLTEVAVGCVFQRLPVFIVSLPIYVALTFLCLSLLYLWAEKEYYACNIVLVPSFTKKRGNENNSQQQTQPALSNTYSSPSFLGEARKRVLPSRFYQTPNRQKLRFDSNYFRRFAQGTAFAFLFAFCFFCLFPRLHEFGIGSLSFNNISWGGRGAVGRLTHTGFKSSIELGDLGPALDSHEHVMTVRFLDCLNPNNPHPLTPNEAVYFRGVTLANYASKSWQELAPTYMAANLQQLENLVFQTGVVNPGETLSYLYSLNEKTEPNALPAKQTSQPPVPPRFPFVSPFESNGGGIFTTHDNVFRQGNLDPASKEMFRKPFFGEPLRFISEQRQFGNFREFDDVSILTKFISQGLINVEQLQYDTRNSVVAYDIELRPLDVFLTFTPAFFYTAKNEPSLNLTSTNTIYAREASETSPTGGNFWFISTAVQNQHETPLTPNLESVWPYLHQYLAIDADRFPELVKLAQKWDEESGAPQDDYVGRAQFIESKIRDTGVFKYNRSGVVRDPNLDPLEDFVALHREGHCEYFAGALTLMLRAIGIPARVVVGFAREPDPNGKPTVVRQSDAHSWVEAYIPADKLPKPSDNSARLFPGSTITPEGENCLTSYNAEWVKDGAWLRLDATPPSLREEEQPDAMALTYYSVSQFFKNFTRDFVVNFNASQQMEKVYTPLIRLIKSVFYHIKNLRESLGFASVLFDSYKQTLKQIFAGRWTSALAFKTIYLTLILIGAAALVYKALKSFQKELKRRKNARKIHATERRNKLADELYRRLERDYEQRLGIARHTDETPKEFVARCIELEDRNASLPLTPHDAASASAPSTQEESVHLNARRGSDGLVKKFIERYYQYRFGALDLTDEEEKKWSALLSTDSQ
ncbi:MAG: transglutaminaseTgpA domain-containing protein [Thermoguttaceae bacterium]